MDAAAGTDADCTAQAGLWNYAKNFTYNAAGAVTSMQLGNGRFASVDPLTASGSAAGFPVFFFSYSVVKTSTDQCHRLRRFRVWLGGNPRLATWATSIPSSPTTQAGRIGC